MSYKTFKELGAPSNELVDPNVVHPDKINDVVHPCDDEKLKNAVHACDDEKLKNAVHPCDDEKLKNAVECEEKVDPISELDALKMRVKLLEERLASNVSTVADFVHTYIVPNQTIVLGAIVGLIIRFC